MKRCKAFDARRQCEQKRKRFAITYLTNDCDVGGHAEEPSDESTKVGLAAVGSGRASLHRGDVGQGDVGFEYFFSDDDTKRRVEFGGTARQHRCFAAAGCAREHHRGFCLHARPQKNRDGCIEHFALDEFGDFRRTQ